MASLALIASGLYLSGRGAWVGRVEAAGALIWRRIEPWSRPLLPVTSVTRALGIGAIWGWLPCGMVYGALLLALASGSAAGGAATMLAFGLGTLPNVLAIGLASRTRAFGRAGPRLRMASGALVCVLGLFGLTQLVAPALGVPELCVVPMAR